MDDLITLDDRLRMIPTDTAALRLAVAGLREQAGETGDPRTLRRLGVGLIALGHYSEAVVVLDRAVRDAQSKADCRSEVAARINLGDAFRYHGDMKAAQTEYERALTHARRSAPELLDYALQHLGKHYLDAGKTADAVECFKEALRLREVKGDEALIASTQSALELACAEVLPSAHGVVQ